MRFYPPAVLAFSACFTAAAQGGFSVEKAESGVSVYYQGKLFTRYVVNQGNKPFLWPVIGPGGKPMTRAYPMREVDGERHDHPHHRSIWFGHQGMDGFDTWHEPMTFTEGKWSEARKRQRLQGLGSTVHRRFQTIAADAGSATIVAESDYVGADGRKLMSDVRTMVFRVGKDRRYIDFDIELVARYGPVTLTDKKDAGFSVRVPTSMDVDSKQGGTIVNSNGVRDKAAWGKRAEWVDYSGPVDGCRMGIAILNHPDSLRHPTHWHVRTYGLFTANPFGPRSLDKSAEDGTIRLKQGESVKLRHRIVFHFGDAESADIAGEFKRYARE